MQAEQILTGSRADLSEKVGAESASGGDREALGRAPGGAVHTGKEGQEGKKGKKGEISYDLVYPPP